MSVNEVEKYLAESNIKVKVKGIEMKKKPMFFRILYPDHTKRYAGSIAEVEEITGIKITDPENFESGGIGNILIEPVFNLGEKRITAFDRAKTLQKIYGL